MCCLSVILRGTVIIITNHGDRIDIPTGAVLENKIVYSILNSILKLRLFLKHPIYSFEKKFNSC